MKHPNASTPLTLKHSPLQKRKNHPHCKTPPPLVDPSSKLYKSKFAASLEYFTKLYEESTKQTHNNNNNNKRILTESTNTLHLSSTEHLYKPRQPPNTNQFVKDRHIRTININNDKRKDNTHNNPVHRSLINIHFHRNNKASIKNERCTTPFLVGVSGVNARTNTTNNVKKYGYECYRLLKSIYAKIKQEEKFYNPDFNYKYTDYCSTNINYSICYDNTNDTNDSKLFSLCYDLKDEILNTLSQLIDDFRKVKTSLVNKHKLCLEENKQFKREIATCKEAIRDYLVDAGNANTNVYGTNELVKVFRKTYMDVKSEMKTKAEETATLVKDVRSYKMMVETYKNALSVAQGKVNVAMKEKEAVVMEVERLREEKEMRRGNEEGGITTVMKTVGEVVKRLVLEIGGWNGNGKVKEYLDIIFKLVGVSESEVSEIYWMKENKKKMGAMMMTTTTGNK